MNIVEEYHAKFSNQQNNGHDFDLIQIKETFMVGIDAQKNPVVVCASNNPNRAVLMQKTRMLSVECNVKVTYNLDGRIENGVVHIIRCFALSQREQDIFLELSPLFMEACEHEDQEDAILEVVATLTTFFSNKIEPSDTELQGFYGELYTMKYFAPSIPLARFWQSKDRMKFDFSISDRLKIEVKSTIKNERRHHFRHEQLAASTYKIFVISYMLRPDDEGLSLWDLIVEVRPMLQRDPRKLLIIDRYLKNASEERLRQCKYSNILLVDRMRIFRAEDIPKFGEKTPSGVSNAEYDCILDNVHPISENTFTQIILKEIEKNSPIA